MGIIGRNYKFHRKIIIEKSSGYKQEIFFKLAIF